MVMMEVGERENVPVMVPVGAGRAAEEDLDESRADGVAGAGPAEGPAGAATCRCSHRAIPRRAVRWPSASSR